MNQRTLSNRIANFCWDAWCCLSIVGIWPRFIEHRLLKATSLTLPIPNFPENLEGLKIAQFSDLHLYPYVSNRFLQKIKRKIEAFNPDILIFTGDFLCFSQLQDLDRLQQFFSSLQAPFGCFAVLGNHDYQEFISVNKKGEYDVLTPSTGSIGNVLKRLWTHTTLTKKTTERAKSVKYNEVLEQLLKKTPFQLLKNESVLIPVKDSFINIVGLEEYSAGRSQPSQAFQKIDPHYPTLVLVHNPDNIPSLMDFPGHLILCGHTHGGQVNLPWLWKKFTLMENPHLKRGLVHEKDKWIYINKGTGSVMPFRWFAMPEVLLLTLIKEGQT